MAAAACYERIVEQFGELHKSIKQLQNRMLREYDISVMEYHCLAVVFRLKNVSQNEIAEALDVDKALISRQIRTMEEKGLLICGTDPDCRRKKTLSLSPRAVELIPKLDEIHRLSLEKLFSDVDKERLNDLQQLLEGLVSKL